MENNDTRIPVTIISGFLGSGKTTLLNKLIETNPLKKFAIIENEFGEINIDSDLVIGVEDGIFELSNGCICCSLNHELAETIQGIIEDYPQINHLIVETTGLADPGPVANTFVSSEQIQSTFRLDAIITVVDALNIQGQLEQNEEASKQIAMADLILLSKTDLVENDTLPQLNFLIQKINPHVSIHELSYGNIEKINLLDIGAFSAKALLKFNFKPILSAGTRKGSMLNNTTKVMVEKSHLNNITSHSIVIDEPLDIIKFDAWMNLMLNFNGSNFYRIKGIISVFDFDQKIIFQAVNSQFVSEGGGAWKENEPRITKMVFIGKNLDKDLLENGIKSCIHKNQKENPEEFYKSIIDTQEKIYELNKAQILKKDL
jgi:G3E family GTPase